MKNKKKIYTIAGIIVILLIIVLFIVSNNNNSSNNLSKENTNNINYDNIVLQTAPDASENRPTREITTKISLADNDIKIDGKGASAKDSILTIKEDGVYELNGKLTNGEIVIDAPDKAEVELVLSGIDISNDSGPAIYGKNADKLVITLTEDTNNVISDTKNYKYEDQVEKEPNATLFTKTDLNIGGKGYLTVNANFNHGINTKDDLVIEGGGFKINSFDDSIRGKDSVTILNGDFEITSGGDGIKSNNNEDEDKGFILIEDGKFNIKSVGDGIQAEYTLSINNGTFDITTNNTSSIDSKKGKGLKAEKIININNGNITIDALDDAIHSNGNVDIKNGEFAIKSKDDAIHADNYLSIEGGKIDILECVEGLESFKMKVNDGDININASDDAISVTLMDSDSSHGSPDPNVDPDTLPRFDMNGGKITFISGDDGIDVNDHGFMYMTGGVIIGDTDSTASMNGPIGFLGTFHITGGTFFGVGNSRNLQMPVEDSTVPSMGYYFARSSGANNKITINDNSGNELYSYTPKHNVTYFEYFDSNLKVGETYTINIGNTKSLNMKMNELLSVSSESGKAQKNYRWPEYGWYVFSEN